jgi:hypothetical protein
LSPGAWESVAPSAVWAADKEESEGLRALGRNPTGLVGEI